MTCILVDPLTDGNNTRMNMGIEDGADLIPLKEVLDIIILEATRLKLDM